MEVVFATLTVNLLRLTSSYSSIESVRIRFDPLLSADCRSKFDKLPEYWSTFIVPLSIEIMFSHGLVRLPPLTLSFLAFMLMTM